MIEQLQLPLNEIQGNILKGHGRKYVKLLLLRFKKGTEGKVKSLIKQILEKGWITTALDQSNDTEEFKDELSNGKISDTDKRFVINCLLSYKGCKFLKIEEECIPDEEAFKAGMQTKRTREILKDKEFHRWEERYWGDSYHVMFIIANDYQNPLCEKLINLIEQFSGVIEKKIIEGGEKIFKCFPEDPNLMVPIEVFGFADGISDPELGSVERIKKILLYKEKTGSFGSFLAYRKIEQDESQFKYLVERVMNEVGKCDIPSHQLKEYIEAQIIGRFRNGTPLTKFSSPQPRDKWNNKFDYQSDDGSKCPFHAHIRKINPRNGFNEKVIFRRGIPYNNGVNDKGLLFMSFQKSIVDQFEFLHSEWANNPLLPIAKIPSGIDPLMSYQDNEEIGRMPQKWNKEWGNPVKGAFYKEVNDIVTTALPILKIRGGEYFYAPSTPFLRNI